ncbi:hypothetical protein DV515_00011744 [Chloebia gouldiae]|uniref:Dihydrofolate reductase n=1 Tax=Chloebia gouldiae TaxID=44316 RepID=A0A3L8S6E8_CHLGU|nr:hypothetical protein DV515_00011744 [Chloebia gouldiae]
MPRSLNSIVAVSQNMGIGKDGRLPWPPLRNEYKYFQRMTSTSRVEGKQNAVIMGKKTWFSIPEKSRPLKDRINIVLSRELKEAPKGAHYLSKSLDDALALLDSPELKSKVDMVWIVGGTSVYKPWWVPWAIQDVGAPALLCHLLGPDAVLQHQPDLPSCRELGQGAAAARLSECTSGTRVSSQSQEAMEKPNHHRLFVTRILKEFESDTFFPEIDHKDYKLLTEYPGVPTDIQEENGIQYKFEVYEKTVVPP